MKLSHKIIIIQLVIIIVIMFAFGIYTYRLKNTEVLENLSQSEEAVGVRLARSLVKPLWNFDTETSIDIIRLELNDKNIATDLKILDINEVEYTNFPFNLIVYPDDQIAFKAAYNSTQVNPEFAEQLMNHFEKVVQSIVENCSVNIDDMSIYGQNRNVESLRSIFSGDIFNTNDKNVIKEFKEIRYKWEEQKEKYLELVSELSSEKKKELLKELLKTDLWSYFQLITEILFDIASDNEDYIKLLEKVYLKVRNDMASSPFEAWVMSL